jgi:hypothetical protein
MTQIVQKDTVIGKEQTEHHEQSKSELFLHDKKKSLNKGIRLQFTYPISKHAILSVCLKQG